MVAAVDGRVAVDAATRQHPVAAVVQLRLVVDGGRVPRVVVAPLAQHRRLGDEHALVLRPVRIVTARAVVAHRSVLVQERPALLGVAADARLVQPVAGLEQLDVGRAVRVVARRALHLALGDRHVRRTAHLGGLLLMARLAQLRLRGGLELVLDRLGVVRAVARRAGEIAAVVRAPLPECVRPSRMARQAGFVARARIDLGVAEPEDVPLVVVIDVGLAGPVAALAAVGGHRRPRIVHATVGRLADGALRLVALQARVVAHEAGRGLPTGQRGDVRAGRPVRCVGWRPRRHDDGDGDGLWPDDAFLIAAARVGRRDDDRGPHRERDPQAGPRTR